MFDPNLDATNPPRNSVGTENVSVANVIDLSEKFAASREFADRRWHRRVIRDALKYRLITRCECAVFIAIYNHWAHHKNGRKGDIIHPGRKRLARSANCSIKTVSRSLSLLEDAGVLTAQWRPKKAVALATSYTFDLHALLAHLGADGEQRFLDSFYRANGFEYVSPTLDFEEVLE